MNLNNLAKSLIALLYGVIFLYLVVTEKLYQYMHPRMKYYILIAGIVLIVIGIYHLRDIRKNIYMKTSLLSFSIFLIPILAGILIDPSEVSSMISNSKGINLQFMDSGSEDKEIFDKNGNIVVNPDNYVYAMKEIYYNMDKYLGKEIEFDGFVFRNEYIQPDEALVGRNIITCCIADASLVGYLISGDNIQEIPDNTWIKVKGKIDKTEFQGDTVPVIRVQSGGIEITERPKNEYIFANY